MDWRYCNPYRNDNDSVMKIIATTKSISPKSLFRHLISGWAIGLLITTLLIFSADEFKPEWDEWWMLKPLIITPLAAAAGMLGFYLRNYLSPTSGLGKITVFAISVLLFLAALWIGIVLGFDGTLWN